MMILQIALYVNFINRYKVTDLSGENVYLIDMNVKICFNDPSPCDLQETVYLKTKLPKQQCPWFTGYPDPSMYDNYIFQTLQIS